jgi:hypothetical protein
MDSRKILPTFDHPIQLQARYKNGSALHRWLITVILLGVFGPYVFPAQKIRTEQIAVYGSAMLLLLLNYRNWTPPRKWMLTVCGIWSLLGAAGVLVTLTAHGGFEWKPLLAGIDHFLSAVALMFVIGSFLNRLVRSGRPLQEEILLFGRMLVFLLSVNTVVELCQLVFGLTFSQHLAMFWDGRGYVMTDAIHNAVAVNSLFIGRLTGIFNQPAEQGVAYGVGMILWAYRYAHAGSRTVDYLTLSFLVIGGVLGVSKIFLLGSLPLVIVYIFYAQVSVRRLNSGRGIIGLICVICLCFAFGSSNEAQSWTGASRIRDLVIGSGFGYLDTVTGGRFQSEGNGSVQQMSLEVLSTSPIFGNGFGSVVVYDNAYFYSLVVAGSVGLGVYLLLLVILASPLWRVRSSPAERPRKVLYALLILFLAASGMGLPTLTSNRASTIIWIFLLFQGCEVGLRRMSRSMVSARQHMGSKLVTSYNHREGHAGRLGLRPGELA